MINSLATGGSERQFASLVRALRLEKIDLRLGCLRRAGAFLEGLDDVEEFDTGGSFLALRCHRARLRLARHLRSQKIAIAHAFDFYSNMMLIPVARLARIPIVIGSHRNLGHFFTSRQFRAQDALFRLCCRVVCNSQAAAAQLVSRGLPSRKVVVIPNGLPDQAFADARPAIPVSPGVIRIGMVARMNYPIKNYPVFLAAAAQLAAKFPNLEFLLVGDAPHVDEIAKAIEANEKRGMRIFGFARIGHAAGEIQPTPDLRRQYPVYSLGQLPQLVRQHVIDEVIFAAAKGDMEKIEEAFLLCEEEGVKTRVLLNFFPHVISKVYLDRLEEMPLLTFTTTPENEYLLLLKRALDFTMALVLLIVLSPLLLLLAVLIRLTSAGPVLYRQVRCGLGGRKFTVYKFRSMHADADLRRDELAALNELDGPVFKIRNDPRCTAAGRFMRKFSLDELPQLVNILKGDMSFVGPRPPLPEEVEKYAGWQRRRLRMQPGLTCLWALEGRNQLNFRRWMELDMMYIDNWSPGLDLKILLKTIPVVLLGRGAS